MIFSSQLENFLNGHSFLRSVWHLGGGGGFMRSFKRKLPIQNKSERENALPAKIRRAFSTHSFSLPSCLYWWNRARGICALLRTPYKRIMSSSKPSSNQATSTFQPIRILLLLSDNQWVIFAPSFSDQSGFFKNWATNECSSPSPRERENVPFVRSAISET